MKDTTYIYKSLEKIPEAELAWLTGFYEGEGSCGFYISKSPRKGAGLTRRIIMCIAQKERKVLEEVLSIVGFGHIGLQSMGLKFGSTCHRYECSGLRAYLLLEKMLPYMRSDYKKEQAEKALKAWADRPQFVEEGTKKRLSEKRSKTAKALHVLWKMKKQELEREHIFAGESTKRTRLR